MRRLFFGQRAKLIISFLSYICIYIKHFLANRGNIHSNAILDDIEVLLSHKKYFVSMLSWIVMLIEVMDTVPENMGVKQSLQSRSVAYFYFSNKRCLF